MKNTNKKNSDNKNNNNKKTLKKSSIDVKIPKKRLVVYIICIFIIFLLLLFRIGWIQFVQGSNLKEEAFTQQITNRIISPKRGTIYDSTGQTLASSASVDTVSVNPARLKYSNGDAVEKEKIAKAFSDIFSLEYEETLEKLSANTSVVTIAKKVELDKIQELKDWMEKNKVTSGINIDEDTKRYYPYNNLASQLIGFCGTDNDGRSGIEYRWDSILAGTPGKTVTITNSINQEIPNNEKTYIPAQNGSDITLTIDFYIQSIAERYLKQAINEHNCTLGGNVIIMQPSTGDILAMATYPDYNLNEPYEPNTTELKNSWDSLSSQDKLNSWFKMWRNKAVSDLYEPGSTFKLINAAIALEENIYSTDNTNDFICNGYQKVGSENLHCWRDYDPHGSQSLRDALENSCNPAFMQLAAKVGARTLYKYYEAFGFFEKTGIALSGEATGYFHSLDDLTAKNPNTSTEIATLGFGQRFSITPLHLITAISAIANDGVLMQPRIVKEIKNTDTGAITTIEPTAIRQVISSETSATMLDLMQSVIDTGTGKTAKIQGYSFGGKTGTSEPDSNKPEQGYTASFVAVAPTTNPQLAILVILYNPHSYSHHGGTLVGPVVKQILSEVLPYLGIPSDNSDNSSETSKVSLRDVRNQTVAEAVRNLKSAGFNVKIPDTSDNNSVLVTDQVPSPGIALQKNSTICLYTNENNIRTSVTVPNLKDMTATQATNALKAKNLNITTEGSRYCCFSRHCSRYFC